MSLVNPTVGEITDRLTILALKRLHGTAEGKNVAHFDREWASLHTALRSRTLNGAWFEQVLELGAVNAALWTRTDEQRTYLDYEKSLDTNVNNVAKCGCVIMRLNDRRAQLVQRINELAGELEGPEKL